MKKKSGKKTVFLQDFLYIFFAFCAPPLFSLNSQSWLNPWMDFNEIGIWWGCSPSLDSWELHIKKYFGLGFDHVFELWSQPRYTLLYMFNLLPKLVPQVMIVHLIVWHKGLSTHFWASLLFFVIICLRNHDPSCSPKYCGEIYSLLSQICKIHDHVSGKNLQTQTICWARSWHPSWPSWPQCIQVLSLKTFSFSEALGGFFIAERV